uniref:Uncharacterized protein n=1 Tax=Zea mays TaxID=4577 RepID=B6TNK1_MAIZE|nr:hypothetical protein [Zea mays]
MACSHLAAAGGSSPAAAAVVRSPTHSPAAAFARLRSTPRFSSAGLSVKGSRAAFPWVAAAGPAVAAATATPTGTGGTERWGPRGQVILFATVLFTLVQRVYLRSSHVCCCPSVFLIARSLCVSC